MNQVVLYAIDADEKIELLDAVGPENVRFDVLPAEQTTYGEPVTIAIVGLTGLAIGGLVAYLLKGRRSGHVTISHIRITTPEGSMELFDVELEFMEEEEASEQLLNALQRWVSGVVRAAP